MIETILKNLAYLFYPKKICSREEENKYNNSEEYNRLLHIINYFHADENIMLYSIKFKEEFENDDVLRKLSPISMVDWQDRAVTFNLSVIENKELYTISLYLSILIPFYTIRVQKNRIELFFSNLEIDEMDKKNLESRKIKDLIIDIESTVENKMLYKKFPKELINVIIDDISFQEIQMGNFTMFNAFFNNQIANED